MDKIKDWIKNDCNLSTKQLSDLACSYGSFVCGLLTALGHKDRCNSCKEKTKQAKD